MAEMILAATSGTEQIYYVIDLKEPGKDGVVLTDTSVFYVPFWSYVTRTQIQPIRTSSFLQDLWDPNGPNSSEWSDVYVSRTEPFPEEVLKQIKPFLVDIPRRKEPEVVDDGLLSFSKKSLPSQVLAKAGRSPLKQEPYDPDAQDGDGDGIVQEGTPWERPAATRFLNEVGEQIERGLTSTARPKGKLVDADGNEVDYTPTYERAETGTIGVGRQIGQLKPQPKPVQPAATEPGKKPVEQPAKPKVGTPLADHGVGSLKEQGLQSVRQTAAPQPPPAPKPPATETPAVPVRIDPEIVDRANIPYQLGVAPDGQPLVYKRDPNDGGPSFEVSVDDKVREILEDIDKFIEDNPDNEEIKRIREELDSEVPDKFERRVRQEVVDRGLNDVIEAYSKPGKSVYVTLPDDKAVEVLRSGRIKTIHETGTSQGQKDPKVRVEVEEARLGVPKDLPAERRPVYGWIRPIKSADGTEEEGALNTEIYGRIHLRLKKGVRSRSTMTLGDTINDKRTGVPLTPERRTETVWGQYGRAVESGGPAAAMTTPDRIRGQMARAAISKSHGDEARSRVHARFLEEYPALRAAIGDAPDFTSTGWGRGFAHYTEVQVHGGVDIEDVDAIEVPGDLPEGTLAELKRLADERGIKVEVQGSKKPGPAPTEVAEVAAPTETLSLKQRIKKKNTEILGRIKERGGSFGRVTKKYKEDQKGVRSPWGSIRTPEEEADARRESLKTEFEAFKFFLKTGKAPTEEDGFPAFMQRSYEYLPEWEQRRDFMDPDLVQHILDTDTDDLIAEIEASAVSFHRGLDASPRVRVPTAQALEMGKTGSYLTTHSDEITSKHSGWAERQQYELVLGIPNEVEDDLRPASGYVTHEALIEASKKLFEEIHGRPPTEFDELPATEGRVGIYGKIEMILSPEVAGRTAYGRGDSLNNASRAALMEDSTDTEIANALLGCHNKEESKLLMQALAYVQAGRTGDYSSINNPLSVWREEDTNVLNRDYIEALIAGSFDLSEVKEVRIGAEARDPHLHVGQFTDEPTLGYPNGAALRVAIYDQFHSLEALKRMGMTDEEIKLVMENDLLETGATDSLALHTGGTRIMQLLELRLAQQLDDSFKAGGVQRVVHLHPSGSDMMDPASYGADSALGDTADAIRVARAERAVVEQLRKSIDKFKNPPAPTPRSENLNGF